MTLRKIKAESSSWCQFISYCLTCGGDMIDVCAEEGDDAPCEGCGGEGVDADDDGPEGAVH